MALGFRKTIPITVSAPADLDVAWLQKSIDQQRLTLFQLRKDGHITADAERHLNDLLARMHELVRDRH